MKGGSLTIAVAVLLAGCVAERSEHLERVRSEFESRASVVVPWGQRTGAIQEKALADGVLSIEEATRRLTRPF